jgi:hypothetical protein
MSTDVRPPSTLSYFHFPVVPILSVKIGPPWPAHVPASRKDHVHQHAL